MEEIISLRALLQYNAQKLCAVVFDSSFSCAKKAAFGDLLKEWNLISFSFIMDRDIKPSFRDSFTVMAFDSIGLYLESIRGERSDKVHF